MAPRLDKKKVHVSNLRASTLSPQRQPYPTQLRKPQLSKPHLNQPHLKSTHRNSSNLDSTNPNLLTMSLNSTSDSRLRCLDTLLNVWTTLAYHHDSKKLHISQFVLFVAMIRTFNLNTFSYHSGSTFHRNLHPIALLINHRLPLPPTPKCRGALAYMMIWRTAGQFYLLT